MTEISILCLLWVLFDWHTNTKCLHTNTSGGTLCIRYSVYLLSYLHTNTSGGICVYFTLFTYLYFWRNSVYQEITLGNLQSEKRPHPATVRSLTVWGFHSSLYSGKCYTLHFAGPRIVWFLPVLLLCSLVSLLDTIYEDVEILHFKYIHIYQYIYQ
jgi:uncharacterized membrane protein YfcA